MQRVLFALFLALSLLLASIPARAGVTTPLVAGQPEGFLGIASILYLAVLFLRSSAAAVRAHIRRHAPRDEKV